MNLLNIQMLHRTVLVGHSPVKKKVLIYRFCNYNFLTFNFSSLSDFSKWVAVRFLRVAAAPDCDVIHSCVSAVLCSLLHTLTVRAPFIFKELTQELILLMQDLSDILYAHIITLTGPGNAVGQTQKQWPVTLQRFSVSPNSSSPYLTPSPLVLSSPAALESLTAVTISVITDVLRGVISRRDLSVVWEVACSFLANGNSRLRKLSMVVLRRLVELRGFTDLHAHDFFTAYLHLLDTQTTVNTGSDEQSYEGELLHLTHCVFQNPGASHTHVGSVYLSQMFECVCTLAGKAEAKLGSEVTESLCFLFSFLLRAASVYSGAEALRQQRVTEVCRTLVQTIGTGHQAEVRPVKDFTTNQII